MKASYSVLHKTFILRNVHILFIKASLHLSTKNKLNKVLKLISEIILSNENKLVNPFHETFFKKSSKSPKALEPTRLS